MNISVVIVLYKPNINDFYKTLDSLKLQINNIYIIINENERYDFTNYKNVDVISLGSNYGIAYAQNRGIERAVEEGADYILLSDQDTIYPSNYIESFLSYIKNNCASVYAPVFFDNIKNIYSPIMIGKFKAIYNIEEPTYVQHAIASGTIIDCNIFSSIGLMNEDLFIDYVDFEWCWRAVSKGYKILTVPSAVINHSLGDGTKKILHKQVTLRSDFRYYYIIRNGYYLSFYSQYLSFSEKFHLFCRTVSFSCGIILLKKNHVGFRINRIAFHDALFKKLGKKERI